MMKNDMKKLDTRATGFTAMAQNTGNIGLLQYGEVTHLFCYMLIYHY